MTTPALTPWNSVMVCGLPNGPYTEHGRHRWRCVLPETHLGFCSPTFPHALPDGCRPEHRRVCPGTDTKAHPGGCCVCADGPWTCYAAGEAS